LCPRSPSLPSVPLAPECPPFREGYATPPTPGLAARERHEIFTTQGRKFKGRNMIEMPRVWFVGRGELLLPLPQNSRQSGCVRELAKQKPSSTCLLAVGSRSWSPWRPLRARACGSGSVHSPGIDCLPPTSGLTEVSNHSPLGPDVSFGVTPLEPVNETPCLVNVSPQGSCLIPDGRWPAVLAGGTVAFKPRQLAGHVVELVTQRADQFHGLGGILSIHFGIVASLASSRAGK
jgi:hypothetical protein